MTTNRFSDSQLEYLNAYGAVFDDCIVIHQYNSLLKIKLELISKVRFNKRRKMRNNLALIMCAIILASLVTIQFLFIDIQFKIMLYALSVLIFFYGILLKKYKYNFVIIYNNSDVLDIEVKSELKEDAKRIFSKINRKIKDNIKSN